MDVGMSAPSDLYRAAERALWASFGASPSERFLSLSAEQRIRIQEVGNGPPALFIHGVTAAGSYFAPLVAHLPDLRCIVLDRPGCGLSDPWHLEPEFRQQAVDTLRGVIDALELESVVLVGNSLGALWSTWFALAHPERVRRLALVGPSIGFPGVHPPAFMRLAGLPGMSALRKRMMRPSHEAGERILRVHGHAKSLDAGRIPAEFFEWGLHLMTDTQTQENDFQAALHAVGLMGARRWIQLGDEALRTLSVPTLLVAGTEDAHGGPQLASRAATLIPNATVEILEGAGHFPWLDDPDAVAAALRRFMT